MSTHKHTSNQLNIGKKNSISIQSVIINIRLHKSIQASISTEISGYYVGVEDTLATWLHFICKIYYIKYGLDMFTVKETIERYHVES